MINNFTTAISAALALAGSFFERTGIGFKQGVKTRCRMPGKPGKPGDKIARLARNSACGLRGKNALKF